MGVALEMTATSKALHTSPGSVCGAQRIRLSLAKGEARTSRNSIYEALTDFSFENTSHHVEIAPMTADELRALQAPLKAQYRERPETALVTLHTEGRIG